MIKSLIKYAIIAAAVFGFMVALRFVPYIKPDQDLVPLSPTAFDQLGAPGSSGNGAFKNLVAYSPYSPSELFGNYNFPGSSGSPSSELEGITGETQSLPTPKPTLPEVVPPELSRISVLTPQEASKTIERIIERIIVREVPVYVPQPISTPATPAAKPVTKEAPQTPICSIQTFENSAGATSHTLLFQCEGFEQCSIAKNGETFLNVDGKGYFNFPGSPPNNYKIRCDGLARVWSSAITPSAGKPLYDQIGFRWFDNDNNEIGGAPLAGVNGVMALSKTGFDPIRLRLAVLVGRVQAAKGDAKFKLQAAFTVPPTATNAANINSGVLCNQIPDAEFKDVNLLDKLAFVDNPDVGDKTLMAPRIEDPFYGMAIPQTYQETALASNANASIPQDVPGIWDFSLRVRSLRSNELACFRFSRGDGASLDAYDAWPAIYNDK